MESLIEFFTIGGPVVVILALFSFVALAVTIVKIAQIWQSRGAGDYPLNRAVGHIENGDLAQAQLLLGDRRNPRADVIARFLALLEKGQLSREDILAEIGRAARSHINAQAAYLRVLEVIAVMAPLLGLLGTVLGMISAFQAMQQAGTQVNPAVLSGGIWEALLTTAVGLVVAIPASLANSWFERRAENTANQINDDIGRIFSAFAQRRADFGVTASRQQA